MPEQKNSVNSYCRKSFAFHVKCTAHDRNFKSFTPLGMGTWWGVVHLLRSHKIAPPALTAFGSGERSSVFFFNDFCSFSKRFPLAFSEIPLEPVEDHLFTYKIHKIFSMKCWMQKSQQARHCWDPSAAGFLLPVQTHLRENSPEEESIVMQFLSYILQSELNLLDNSVDKRF